MQVWEKRASSNLEIIGLFYLTVHFTDAPIDPRRSSVQKKPRQTLWDFSNNLRASVVWIGFDVNMLADRINGLQCVSIFFYILLNLQWCDPLYTLLLKTVNKFIFQLKGSNMTNDVNFVTNILCLKQLWRTTSVVTLQRFQRCKICDNIFCWKEPWRTTIEKSIFRTLNCKPCNEELVLRGALKNHLLGPLFKSLQRTHIF